MVYDIRWKTKDRDGNEIYITEERWEHIIDSDNHPEMEACEDELMEAIETGRRKQETLNPQKYRYQQRFSTLESGNSEIEAVVLFRFKSDESGATVPNNYIVTAYQK
jgi:hypothetical protein